MRTPLSGIIGMTDILMRSGLTSRQAELMKVVKESSDSLLELISNIHQLSAIEAHGIKIRKDPFMLGSLMDKTLGIFRAAALEKEINLIHDYEEIRNIRLLGDEFRLQQILTNLLANAIKFTKSGGNVTVSAMANTKPGNATELRISIKDTGIGIPGEKTPILFDKFTQADSSYTREHEGAGIGLAISKELIELMGGTIGVNSEYMKGAEFWIRLTLPNAS
jgi:signal transduction histidine kinase